MVRGHVLGSRPLGEIHLYVYGEAAGFAKPSCIWAKGSGSKGGLYVQETKFDLWVKYLGLESPR